jgi:ubiquinol-cytochrome c reductase cytochrome b subunit
MKARRLDELFMPIPRHLVPLPTPRRALAQLRARVNHFYVLSRLETPSAGPPPGMDGAGQPGRPARRRKRSRIRDRRPGHHALRAGRKD